MTTPNPRPSRYALMLAAKRAAELRGESAPTLDPVAPAASAPTAPPTSDPVAPAAAPTPDPVAPAAPPPTAAVDVRAGLSALVRDVYADRRAQAEAIRNRRTQATRQGGLRS